MERFHLVGSGLLFITLFSKIFSWCTFSKNKLWPVNSRQFILSTSLQRSWYIDPTFIPFPSLELPGKRGSDPEWNEYWVVLEENLNGRRVKNKRCKIWGFSLHSLLLYLCHKVNIWEIWIFLTQKWLWGSHVIVYICIAYTYIIFITSGTILVVLHVLFVSFNTHTYSMR